MRPFLILLYGLMVVTGDGHAQHISLQDALRRASHGAFSNRIAAADARAASAAEWLPARGILPSLRLETGWTRTSDPIAAFGTTLRQRAITPADFDPARLNDPVPISNFGAALVLEQPLLNVDAHIGRRAAARGAEASAAGAEWTSGGVGVDVVRAYYAGVLTGERVATLEAAHAAALAHVRQAQALVEQGVVTKSDALLAQVKAGDLEAQLAAARSDASLVVRNIALLLGAPADTALLLPTALPETARLLGLDALDWSSAVDGRADVRAAAAGRAAAQLDARRARSALLPRLNGVARYDWNSADSPFRGAESWSVGIMATWSFSGAAEIADMGAANARAAAARARSEAAGAQAELEALSAASSWQVALERLRLAERSLEQAAEAHRIVTRMYSGGLATATELLGAAAVETETRLRLAAARYDVTVAAAERLHAIGRSAHELAAALAAGDN
jgi:outer membrane protein